MIWRERNPSRGFQSSVDYKIIAGLGKRKVDSITVTWPDRTVTHLLSPALNQLLTIDQSDAQPGKIVDGMSHQLKALLTPVAANFDKHTEREYYDFYDERNIPKMTSREGPCSAVGDVNGDGLKDIFIGGARGQSGQLYLQTVNGFSKKTIPSFDRFAMFEDVAAVFFDCDNDNDLDLFVGAGGNDVPKGSEELQHRLYINDGKGNFEIGANFPPNFFNTGVAVPYDADNDGDIDLFVGARSTPKQYGIVPESHMYLNDGKGNFTAVDNGKMAGSVLLLA